MTESEQHALVGKTVGGKYKITALLGEGGMGSVWVGEQQMGTAVRKVAVKTLHEQYSRDPQVKARFERECGIVAHLEHPNTIQVYDFGTTDDGQLYIVMELVQGKSVADLLEKGGPMPAPRVERILSQVTGSLEEAHGHGIVHRDLKPDNVVICDRAGQKDWVEVLDFGIAKRSSEHDPNEAKLTQQGMVVGTPPYMSPEQFTGKPIDARSDIYALGVMSYEMLTGRLPFNAGTAWEWASAHMTTPPTPIEEQPGGGQIPEKMRGAVMRAMAKDPAQRFASVREFFDAFATGITTGSIAAVPAPEAPAPSGGGGAPARAKTELGAPMAPDFGAPAGAFGGGQGPGVGHGPPPGGGYGAPAVVPAAPPRTSGKGSGGGGSKGLLVAAGVVGVLALVGVAVGLGMSKKKEVVTPPLDLSSTATPAHADLGATASASAAAPDPGPTTPTNPTVAPLDPGKPSASSSGGGGGSSSGAAAGGGGSSSGGKTPSTVPTPKPGGGGAVTPPKAEPPECAKARELKAKKFPAAVVQSFETKCIQGGGKP